MTSDDLVPASEAWPHFRPNADEMAQIYGEAVVVVDTNALLHVCRIPPSAGEALVGGLEALHAESRLFVPHQVRMEFKRNLPGVAIEAYRTAESVAGNIRSSFSELRAGLEKKAVRRSRAIDPSRIREALQSAEDDLTSKIMEVARDRADYERVVSGQDPLVNRVVELSRVACHEKSDQSMEALRERARERLADRKPPGTGDIKKDGDRPLGDGVIWLEVLDFCSSEPSSALLVSEESKPDWLRSTSGVTLGPLPFLRYEFHEETGCHFWSESVSGFLYHFEDMGLGAVSDEALGAAESMEGDDDAIDRDERRRSLLLQAYRALGDEGSEREPPELVEALGELLELEFGE